MALRRVADSLFPNFINEYITVDGATISVLTGGTGPVLLLLHGYPETRTAWHRLASALANNYTVIIPDLPGYGSSRFSTKGPDRASKRNMAKCLHEMMKQLGHQAYSVIGHDRGGRVAYRMALDFPQAITALVSVTVVPTAEMWEGASKAFGMGAWHWFMMAQPAPLPEKLMAGDPRFLIDQTLEKMARGLEKLDPLAVEEYRAAFDREEVRHAMCDDYRAGAGIDHADDLADRNAGRKVLAPVLLLWEEGRLYGGGREPLHIWSDWADNVDGRAIAAGHLIPETAPEEMLASLLPFLERNANAAAG